MESRGLVKSRNVMAIEVEVHGYGSGHFKRLEGRLLTLLESLGLPASQEKAIKDLVRNELWDVWDLQAPFVENKKVQNPTLLLENSYPNTDK
jgi:hypothetical protein